VNPKMKVVNPNLVSKAKSKMEVVNPKMKVVNTKLVSKAKS